MCEQYWLFMVGLWASCVSAILVIHGWTVSVICVSSTGYSWLDCGRYVC